ncbi:TetR/AcrR family transcriptional regulator [Nocardia sp. CA-135398]|uniref:TetR/AcrR family transcriptional regulator n=1 Tax=Nocardia sp. CA-135398 TaxID=3239977 RepID=UPI003D994B9A
MATAAGKVVAAESEGADAAAVSRIHALIEQMDRCIEETTPSLGRSDTRERILEVAMGLFAQRGFEACTVRDLAGAVGIKPPGIYSHFRSKEAILSEAMLRALPGYPRRARLSTLRRASARRSADTSPTNSNTRNWPEPTICC